MVHCECVLLPLFYKHTAIVYCECVVLPFFSCILLQNPMPLNMSMYILQGLDNHRNKVLVTDGGCVP